MSTAMNFERDTGGVDPETNEVFDAAFHCFDCGLYYSWPVTPGLAPNADPKQTEMLALVRAHTPAACRVAQAAAAVEQGNAQAEEKAFEYNALEGNVTPLNHIGGWTVASLEKLETEGYPYPVGGDCKVSLQQAIERGAVTVTRGLPEVVIWNRANPGLAKARNFVRFKSPITVLWPGPSHEALTASITALAATQRKFMIGGRLAVAP